MMVNVCIGVFAHNEAGNIPSFMTDLARQSVLRDRRVRSRVIVLANGCTDGTVVVADEAIGTHLPPGTGTVADMPMGGKSRTWNEFVHRIAPADADFLVFCDADIRLPEPSTVLDLVTFLEENPEVRASSSRPVKDLDFYPQPLNMVERAIVAGGGTLGDTRHAVCGQLYVMRGDAARALRIPIGLPVEDGFVRHALITHGFTVAQWDYGQVDRPASAFHLYDSEREIGSLVRHQIRVVIGGAINAALFRHLGDIAKRDGRVAVRAELDRAAKDERWLPQVMAATLPNRRFGWVPRSFLDSRIRGFIKARRFTGRRSGMAVIGFGFDMVVYVAAQIKMARGQGAGYW